MNRPRLLIVLAAVLLAAVLLGTLARPRHGGRAAPPATPAALAAGNATAARDAGTTAAPGAGDAMRSALAFAEPAPAGSAAALLTGTVRDPTGAPVAGARVQVTRRAADEYGLLDRTYAREAVAVATVATGADGSYRVPLPPRRPHRVHVTADGFAPAFRDGACAGSQLDVVLEPPAALEGIVLRADDRSPVAGARVHGWRQGHLGATPLFDGHTGPDGRFRFDGLSPGPCTFDVAPRDLGGPRWQEADLRAGGTVAVEILVPPGVDVRGTVVDDLTSLPVAGAIVREGGVGRRVHTDVQGRFALPGFNRRAHLAVEVDADGYAPTEVLVAVRGTADEVRTGITVRLRRGRRAHGRVFDTAGRPLGNVYVAATASEHREQLQHTDWVATRSDADGAFALTPLRPDLEHTLFLRAEGHATMVYDFPVGELQHADLDLGSFRMERPGGLAGRLVDEREEPLAGREVTLSGWNRDRFRDRPPAARHRSIDGYVGERQAVTDAAGRFAFDDLAAGDYEVASRRMDSHSSVTVAVALEPGEVVGGVTLTVPRGLSIAGTVATGDGGPLPTCYLSIDPEDGQDCNGDLEVDRDGGFRARGLLAGSYRLTAYPYANEGDVAAGRSFLSVATPHVPAGSEGVRIVLPVTRAVRGLVLRADGSPAAGMPLQVAGEDGVHDSGSTDEGGRFALRGPAGRMVEVLVLAPGAPGEGPAVLARTVAEPGGAEVTLGLPR